MIGYRPPPLPEQPIPQAPHIPVSLFRRVAGNIRAGTGRRGFTPVSSVAALGKAQARRARENRSERRAEQGYKLQRQVVRAQQQKAKAEEVGAVAGAIKETAAQPRRKRGARGGGPQPVVPVQARNVPKNPPKPTQPKQPPKQPPVQPQQPKKPGKKRTKKAFQHAGLGPQGKSFLNATKKQQKHAMPGGPRRENPRNPAITTPLNQPAGMQNEEPLRDMADVVYKNKENIDVGEVGQRAIIPEKQAELDEITRQKAKSNEERLRLEMQQAGMSPDEIEQGIRVMLNKEINTPQEHNLLRDLADLFPPERSPLGTKEDTVQIPIETKELGESTTPATSIESAGPTMILPPPKEPPPVGPRGNVSPAEFKTYTKRLIRTHLADARNYERNMAGDEWAMRQAFRLRENAKNLRSMLKRYESENPE